jgi:hypothetical protein
MLEQDVQGTREQEKKCGRGLAVVEERERGFNGTGTKRNSAGGVTDGMARGFSEWPMRSFEIS